MDTEPIIWGIHGGHTGDANTLFLKGRYIALGWHEMGNLAILAPDGTHSKERVAAVYPAAKPGDIPVSAGQLFRFIHEMREGDIVAP